MTNENIKIRSWDSEYYHVEGIKVGKIFKILAGLLSLAFLCLIFYIVGIQGFFVLSELDKTVSAALLTAAGVAITAIIVKHVEHRHTVEAQFRDNKVKLFQDFLLEYDKLSLRKGNEDDDNQHLVEFLKDWQRKIIFWGGPSVLKNFLALKNGMGPINTVQDMGNVLQLMGDLILSMRKDLGLSNIGINRQAFAAHLILRHATLFLSALKTNPSMKLSEYEEIEK